MNNIYLYSIIKLRWSIFLCLLFFTYNSFSVNGKITDKKGNPIPSAKIVFTNAKNPYISDSTYSDANGYYTLDIPTLEIQKDKNYTFFNIYPNPSNGGTVIPFYLNHDGICSIIIYNIVGQKIKTISDGFQTSGLHQLIWDGTTDYSQRAATGIYFVNLFFEGRSATKKIIMQKNENTQVFPDGIPINQDIDTSKYISYNVQITSTSTLPFSIGNFIITDEKNTDFILYKRVPIPFKVSGKYLSINNGDNIYDTVFVNGINLGVGMPGKYPGEMAATSDDYKRWFVEMGEIGFNAIRTYTLHYPRFYDELAKYNMAHPEKPLYLLQGVWLDEDKSQGNFFSYTQEYDLDIKEMVDCMHGNKVIAERPGRASGTFTTNISPWIMAYIIGREIHPYEVQKTNGMNWGTTSYIGYTMRMPPNSQPTECWLAQRMDKMIVYERQRYQTERPISVSSWPTLDPIYHKSEHENQVPGYVSEEDVDSLDFGRLQLTNLPAGFFLTYHAYPYYPDFITDDEGYLANGADPYGMNSYVNYILTLWDYYDKHTRYPVIIGEYGVPSSWGNAHYANSGMNHGGHDYDKQGFFNARLLENIHDSAYMAGGCLFSWIDEWFKQTWITNRITCTPDRRLMWHNLASPEDNFGLKTFIPDTVIFTNYQGFVMGSDIENVKAAHDFQFFHLKINLTDSMTINDTLWVAFDTYKDTLGEFLMPNGKPLIAHLSEFALRVTKDSAHLYVTRAYNTYNSYFNWWNYDSLEVDQLYRSIKSYGKPWDLVMWKNGYKDTAIQYLGRLVSCDSLDIPTSLNAVTRNKYSYDIRIPWQLINFTDPSKVMVLNDFRNTPEVESEFSDGIAITVFYRNTNFESDNRYYWDWWGYYNQNTGEYIFPKYKEVKKKSFDIFKDRIKNLNLKPIPQ